MGYFHENNVNRGYSKYMPVLRKSVSKLAISSARVALKLKLGINSGLYHCFINEALSWSLLCLRGP